jgi:hypothetical protein
LQREEQNSINWNPLYVLVENVFDKNELKRNNRLKSWKYGYDKKHDVVIISKDGTVGQVYEIEGLKIALPKQPDEVENNDNVWIPHEAPKELSRIKSRSEWVAHSDEFKSKHIEYISREFDRREYGHWFINNKIPTYITGHHYMYLQHTKIDVGHPDFREANRVFYIYWEACKADSRCFGMIYLKIRRSGFSFMGASVGVDTATLAKDSRVGILSKTGPDAKKLFTDKVVPMSFNYPFFFKPLQSGMDRPKTELLYSLPATKITKKNMHNVGGDEGEEGLDTSIDWKNTDDNSYDGEKLLYLLHDESGKWLKPLDIKNNWRVTKTCLRLGRKIIGKCLMGSTCNALAKGGQNFKDLYYASDPNSRSANGQTRSGMYKLFIPMEWNFEGYIDKYGMPVFETPDEPVEGVDGEMIDMGVIEYWQNEADSLKSDPDALNEFFRQFPRTEAHAFRDESKESLFNLTKLYEQIDYNDATGVDSILTRGSFHWKDGKQNTEVVWSPDKKGRFLVSWLPPNSMRNKVVKRGDLWYPCNENIGAFGCDPYDISGTVGGGGSNGALHGVTMFNMTEAPSNEFFLEYVARPQTAEIFFEDIMMAIWFYGMPILIENNKQRLLYAMRDRGMRRFSIDRPDKNRNKFSKMEKEIGGIPMSSEDVRQAHAAAIETYVEKYVGRDSEGTYRDPDEVGTMHFNRTLEDWARFDYNNRTKFDATISSGLALMAIQRFSMQPKKEVSKISLNFVRYDNGGKYSKILRDDK